MIEDYARYRLPDSPAALKEMSLTDAERLAASIRAFLLDTVSETGGHLASNLGVVELTIALHRVFDSPRDKIIWDVGHQSYVHKILTGRGPYMDSLRRFGGLSGFPKGAESPHDAFDTGHSSVSVSAAAGIAAARDLAGDDYEVIAVIGDGSLTGGQAYEGLNNIGASKSKVIVVLNDNGMSISPNIGGISEHLTRLRTSRGYLSAKRFVKERVGALPLIGAPVQQALANLKNDLKYSLLSSGILFEELGFTYFGPVDGHDIGALTDVLQRARSLDEPTLVHVITKKGKGYRNAELDPAGFHGIGPFDKETGLPRKRGGAPSFSAVAGQTACELAAENPKVVAITAAMCEGTGLGGFAKRYPKRFFDVGIAEQHAVTFAAGLAKEGYRPLVAIYSSFLQRAYDQILEDVCLQNLPVLFLVDRAGCVGADGQTHHGLLDLAYLRQMPGMTVLAPEDGTALRAMMRYAMTLSGPCAIRYPKGAAWPEDGERRACAAAAAPSSAASAAPDAGLKAPKASEAARAAGPAGLSATDASEAPCAGVEAPKASDAACAAGPAGRSATDATEAPCAGVEAPKASDAACAADAAPDAAGDCCDAVRLFPAGRVDIWGVGPMVRDALAVRRHLAEAGLSAGVLGVRQVKPLPLAALMEVPAGCTIVTLEDGCVTGGFGAGLSLAAGEARPDVRVLAIGWPDAPVPHGSISQLRQAYGLSAEAIAERIRDSVEGAS